MAADAALFSADGASSPTANTISTSAGLAQADAVAVRQRRSIDALIVDEGAEARLPVVEHADRHARCTISAWTREMSPPGSRRSVSLRRPMVNDGLSMRKNPPAERVGHEQAWFVDERHGTCHALWHSSEAAL